MCLVCVCSVCMCVFGVMMVVTVDMECESEGHMRESPERATTTCLINIIDYMFAGCKGITTLSLPDGITTIGDGAFSGECTGGMG